MASFLSRKWLILFCSLTAASPALAWQSSKGTSVRYPWVYPSDIRERIELSNVVVSGTIISTQGGKKKQVDNVDVLANTAAIRVDRTFKGTAAAIQQFVWFSSAPTNGGVIYSGPPLASFRPDARYVVFLRRRGKGHVVTMPIYALEIRLAPLNSSSMPANVADLPVSERNSELAQELERSALSIPPPAPGVTGEAATYFPYVVQLIGGCAQPFLRQFATSPSKELRAAAQNWLALLAAKRLHCETNFSISK